MINFLNRNKVWLIAGVIVVAIICACTLKCGPIIWLVLLGAWLMVALREEAERVVQEREQEEIKYPIKKLREATTVRQNY